ncbi:MAG: hypothetical protein ACR2QS_09440 [Woeseiaceae bacterium]
MKLKQLVLVVATLCMSVAATVASAQEDEDSGNIYVVSTLQWPFNNLDEIFEMMEEVKGLVDQNEYVLSRKVLTHFYAGAFSVMTITEHASLADIDKANERGNELFLEAYPDEADREARGEAFLALAGSGMHVDSIVQEVPELTK